jgi:hypothetical protein
VKVDDLTLHWLEENTNYYYVYVEDVELEPESKSRWMEFHEM